MTVSSPRALRVLPGSFGVARLPASADLPEWVFAGAGLAAVVRRGDELSVVCAEAAVPADVTSQTGFCAIEVAGPLEFAETGVLSSIAHPLAEAGVPIFVLSTFDTDVVLVPGRMLDVAIDALGAAGHQVLA